MRDINRLEIPAAINAKAATAVNKRGVKGVLG